MTQENELKTIMEDAHILAVLTNAAKPGCEVDVTIRRVPLRSMDQLLQAQGDDLATARIYLGDDAELAEKLTDDSLMDVLEKGDEINAPLFERWFRRTKAKAKRMGLDLDAEMQGALESAKSLPTSSDADSTNGTSLTAASQSSGSTTGAPRRPTQGNKPS